MDRSAFAETCKVLRVVLTDDQLDAFDRFEAALYLANESKNLTRVPRAECWTRHFVDSLLIAEFAPFGASVLDLGTGPGFPAWPLACARPDLAVTALDSNGKMLAFLATQPLPNLTIAQARAEDKAPRERFDVVTGRALAPLAVQLELSAAPCKIGGHVVPMRTPNDEPLREPPDGLGLVLFETERRELPSTGIVRVFPLYKKVRATDRRYPRPWAEMRSTRKPNSA